VLCNSQCSHSHATRHAEWWCSLLPSTVHSFMYCHRLAVYGTSLETFWYTLVFSIHYSAWYKIQLHSSHLNVQKGFWYLRLRFELLHFKIHATTFLYTVLSNILQNVTLNYIQHLKAGCTILAIGCYRPLLLLNQELLGENAILALTGQLTVADICCIGSGRKVHYLFR